MARSITTTDHETIRKWADERGGKPSEVASTAKGDDVGIIRIDFPGSGGEGKLREVSWDDWFKKFDESNLAFVYEEETAEGQRSNFNKLVGRETAAARTEGKRTNRRSLRSGGRTTARARGSRQAARPEAARTTRSGRSTRGGSAARGSTRSRKGTSSSRTRTSRGAGSSRKAASARKSSRSRGTKRK